MYHVSRFFLIRQTLPKQSHVKLHSVLGEINQLRFQYRKHWNRTYPSLLARKGNRVDGHSASKVDEVSSTKNESLKSCTATMLLRGMHYFGSCAFAFNGATIAGSAGMHILGCMTIGAINAIGGGTIRDILTGNAPVFWMRQPQFVYIAMVASGLTFFLWPYLEENDLNWEKDSFPMILSDACGVASISIVGAQNGLQLGLNPFLCVMLGVVSSSFGGVVRDILCEQPPRIFYNHAHLYASTAFCGSAMYVSLKFLNASPPTRISLAVLASMFSRYMAWKHNLTLSHWEWVEEKKMGHHFEHAEIEKQ